MRSCNANPHEKMTHPEGTSADLSRYPNQPTAGRLVQEKNRGSRYELDANVHTLALPPANAYSINAIPDIGSTFNGVKYKNKTP